MTKKEETEEISLEVPLLSAVERVNALEERFEKSIAREEEHYEEYKYFENRTMKFEEEFPYNRLNWLGKLLFWIICKRK